ncbi:MAG: AAA domain-containing protein, partial [Ilumatobacteraceae bacterium]
AELAEGFKRDQASKGKNITDLDAALAARRYGQASLSAALDKSLKTVKQKAKETLLDTGTSCLFLGLGAVTWTSESDGRGKATATTWEAPLYLYPVILDGGRKTPYTLRLDATGEATPNHCLREKLRRDPYNIDLPELINPATDESGLDFDRMFESIRARLAEAKMHNFAVVPRVYLGVFDYSTFRLWADLHDSWKEMADTSAAAKHLILTPNQQFPTPSTTTEAPEPYLPIDADDSQEQAIRWALEGKSFRLEGPPGTGKTQTITNLLASCLAHGKKILFVAEKQTALDQVKKRMAAIGLSDYCLDLHAQGDSDARIRKNIETALTTALAAQADAREAEWKDVEFRIGREIEVLDRYRDALHEVGPAELSAWGINERLLAMPDLEAVPLRQGFLTNFSSLWPEVRRVIYEIRDLSTQSGTTTTNLWSFVDPGGQIEPDSEEVRRVLRAIGEATNDLSKLQDIPDPIRAISDPRSFEVISSVRALNYTWGQINQVILSGIAATATWFDKATQAAATTDALLARIGDNLLGPQTLLSIDLATIDNLRTEVTKANFISRRKKVRALREALPTRDTASDDEVLAAIDQLLSERDTAEQLRSTLGGDLGLSDAVIDAAFGRVGNLGDLISELRRISEIVASDDAHRDSLAAFSQAAFSMSPMTSQLIISVADAWAELLPVLPVSAERFSRRFGEGGLIKTAPSAITDLENSSSASGRFLDLDRWVRLMAAIARLEEFGFTGHRKAIADGDIDFEQLVERIQLSVIKEALVERLQSGNLDRFDRKTHDSRVRALERALDQSREILFDRIAGLIKARSSRRILPSGRPGGETQDLIRGLRPKRGEKVPIRDLITKFGESLADAMPCFMMSPDSVASLVPVGAINFDVVIFDEASQVRTSHAIGALGRGRAGIVVGDSKQMPPSSTFSSNLGAFIDSDDPEDDDPNDREQADSSEPDETLTSLIGEAARDAESILSEFEESGFPALQLMCHYRSRDELLIAFSNTHVYDEPMLTFPSTAGLSSGALRLLYVNDGHFERAKKPEPWVGKNSKESVPTLRTNLREAEAVVSEIISRLRDPERVKRRMANPGTSAESIIVVTFNRPQMDLVDAMLRDADAELYATATTEWTDEDTGVKHDPQLKVRNLENVQGDEAETVIFSVAFSARKDGNFPLNFGPITQQGGIRRLNVAVTRAQVEMLVFASFRPDDMGDLSSKSEGAQMLQKFLQLAESGAKKSASVGVAVARSAHLREIANAIESLGFVTQVQLGLSQMRVDIAVRRPESTNWELAILADDPNWASRGSSFQREILPTRILAGLGWRAVMRVWLPAWLDEREAILSDITARLRRLDSDPTGFDDGSDDIVEEVDDLDPPGLPPLPEPSMSDRHPDGLTPPSAEPSSGPSASVGTPFTPFQPRAIGGIDILDRASSRAADEEIVRDLIDTVAQYEGPVESRRLAKFVANCLGLSKVPENRIKQVLEFIEPRCVAVDALGTFIYPTTADPADFKGFRSSQEQITRQPSEISLVEYANAAVWLLESVRSLSVDDMTRELGGLFGFKRMTQKVTGVLQQALDAAVASGRLAREEDRFRLPS